MVGFVTYPAVDANTPAPLSNFRGTYDTVPEIEAILDPKDGDYAYLNRDGIDNLRYEFDVADDVWNEVPEGDWKGLHTSLQNLTAIFPNPERTWLAGSSIDPEITYVVYRAAWIEEPKNLDAAYLEEYVDREIEANNLLSQSVSNTIEVYDKSQIINKELDPSKVYKLEFSPVLLADESIMVGSSLTIVGDGFNVTSISTTAQDGVIFKSLPGGSGDLIIQAMELNAFGTDSKVFDLTDSDGTHAIEMEYLNFVACKSLGEINGYRQGTGTTLGFYGCIDGLILSGQWNGFKFSNSNLFGFSSTGTFLKSAADTSFSNRLFINLNFDVPTGSKIIDFDSSNLEADELLQFNSCIAKVNGVISIDNAAALIPNISANNKECLWIGNIGLPDSATEILVEDNSVGATYMIDWLKDTFFLTMADNTTFTEKNLPAANKNTQEIKIYLTGNYTPTFPNGWLDNVVGTYTGSDVNEISVKFIKNGVYFMRISNSLSVYPAPFLYTVTPSGVLPNTQRSIILKGEFYTPSTQVKIQGQTVDGINFIDTQTLEVIVSSGISDGDYNITISNGQTVVFQDKLTVSNGTVTVPAPADFILSGDIRVIENNVRADSSITPGAALWNTLEIPQNQKFTLQFIPAFSSFDNTTSNKFTDIEFRNTADTFRIAYIRVVRSFTTGGNNINLENSATKANVNNWGSDVMAIRRTATKIQLLRNGLVQSEVDILNWGTIKVKFTTQGTFDFNNIKYIAQ